MVQTTVQGGEDEGLGGGALFKPGNQAGILKAWGRLEEAMALLKKQEELCMELGETFRGEASQGNAVFGVHGGDS
jgi:hypothetical protein